MSGIDHIPILHNIEKKPKQVNPKKFILYFWIAYIVSIILVTLFFVGVALGVFGSMPTFEELENPKSSLATEILSEDGKLLGKYYFENRTNTHFQELSPNVINALIATEDARFYEHSGIDFRAIFRVVGVWLPEHQKAEEVP